MYDEYVDRVSEVVTGIVQQAGDRNNVLVDLGKVEALLPRSEQVDGERYEQGSRIKAVITEVRSGTKGPQVILSRRDPELIKTLFELEVPEIADGLVEIRGVAREPGYRSKIAVESHAQGVDPVGACVGPRGSRVRMVVSELRGEKIDIIPWNTEPARFVAKALSPARVREVYIDDESRDATVVVPGRPARARHRQGGPERPPRRAAHGLEGRHRLRHRVRAAGSRGGVRRRGRRRLQRPLCGAPRERQALSQHVASGLALLRCPGAPGAGEDRGPDRRVRAGHGHAHHRSAGGRGRRGRLRGRRGRSRAADRRRSRTRGSTGRGDTRSSRSRPSRTRRRGGHLQPKEPPIRTCAGCGRKAPQPDLLRFAAVDGELTAGRTLPGRGVYTCRRLLCFERALTHRGFNRVLKQSVTVDPALSRLYTRTHDTWPISPTDRSDPAAVQARAASAASSSTRAASAAAARPGARAAAARKSARPSSRARSSPRPGRSRFSPASPSATSRRRSASRCRS